SSLLTRPKNYLQPTGLSPRFEWQVPDRVPQAHVLFKGHVLLACRGHDFEFSLRVALVGARWNERIKAVSLVIVNQVLISTRTAPLVLEFKYRRQKLVLEAPFHNCVGDRVNPRKQVLDPLAVECDPHVAVRVGDYIIVDVKFRSDRIQKLSQLLLHFVKHRTADALERDGTPACRLEAEL